MLYRFKKRLLHFTTNGNIAEDFVKARHVKVKELRRKIRICFYIHCAAVVLCAGAAVVFGALPDIIQTAVCAVVSTLLALFAASDRKNTGIAACAADALFTAASVLMAVFTERKAVYIVCGGFMLAALVSISALTALNTCKRFLLEYSPLSIRREDYTLLNEVGYKLQTSTKHAPPQRVIVENEIRAEDDIPPLPPLTSEMRELAGKVRDILTAADGKSSYISRGSDENNGDRYSSNSH